MRPIGLVDLDDTLGDLNTPMLNALNIATGRDINVADCKSFNIPKLYEISDDDFINILIDYKVLENVVIHESSFKFLNDLHELGYYTTLITARGWHPNGKAITEQWVDNHNLDIDELIVVGLDQSKTDVIDGFDNIVFSIDDRIKHCREYMQCGKIEHVLVYDAPWNSHMTKWNKWWEGNDYHERIYDLHEIIEHVEWANRELPNRRIYNVC